MKKGRKTSAIIAALIVLLMLGTFMPNVFADELREQKQIAIERLSAYFPLGNTAADYDGLGKEAYDAAIAAATNAINAAADQAEIAAARAAGEAAIDALQTDDEITASLLYEINNYYPSGKQAADYDGLAKEAYDNAVSATIVAIEAASSKTAADTALANGKAAIDALKTDTVLETEAAAKELADAKQSAINALNAYNSSAVYSQNQLSAIQRIIANYTAQINSADTPAAVTTLRTAAITELENIPTHAEQESAYNTLSSYSATLQSNNEYPADTAEKFENILTAANRNIYTLSSDSNKADLANLVTKYKVQMDNIKTVFRLKQDAAIDELVAYVDRETYREAELADIDAIITEYTAKINAATTEDELSAALAEGKSKLDEVKTDLQYIKEQLCAELDAYYADIDKTLYYEAQLTELSEALNSAKATINDSESEQAAQTAFADGKKLIDAVKTMLDLYKDEAIEVLSTYKNRDNYSSTRQGSLVSLIAQGSLKIKAASSNADVDKELETAKANLDAIPTKTDEAAAKTVDNVIFDLPATIRIKLSDRSAIEAARAAYNKLTSVQKKCVNYTSQLTAAEAKLMTFLSGAEKTSYLIGRIGTNIDSYSEDLVAEARASYDALSETQKAAVTNYASLTAAEAALLEQSGDALWVKGDINRDKIINAADLSALLSVYGSADKNSDINSDGVVNAADLSLLLKNYGTQK